MKITGLHHFAIPMPAGREDEAIRFYTEILGIPRVPKPPALQVDGGLWFELPDGRQVHLQIDTPFSPLLHPHPALICDDVEEVAKSLESHGLSVRFDTRWDGVKRFFTKDPFGNRIEILQGAPVSA